MNHQLNWFLSKLADDPLADESPLPLIPNEDGCGFPTCGCTCACLGLLEDSKGG